MTAPAWTAAEMMTIAASRQLAPDDVCFVGIGAPSAACNLARLLHAPDIVLVYESGTIGTRPDVLPLSIGDGELCSTALTTVSVPEMFRYWLQAGRITKGFLGGAQIDRYGNINTTVIGPYDRPRVRLPGGGGAPEIASSCDEVLVTATHAPRTLVDRVEFVTSLGHGRGPGDRRAAGSTTVGPTTLITDLCVMSVDAAREFVVESLHVGVTRREVVEATGWPVRFVSDLVSTPAPTDEELTTLRDLQARTERAHAAR
ncbi:MAG: CoA-transferase subunit beta [Nitriliruptoraceae bacterium]|nr:CoA-transferase subunit beta [Nitriliruptoraceae bacterium]